MRYQRKKRKNSALVEGLIRAPWWVSAALGEFVAFLCWMVWPRIVLPGSKTNQLVWSLNHALHQPSLIHWMGWLSMLGGLGLALASWLRAQSRKRLLDRQRGLDGLRSMTWQEFEQLVGECFLRHGYKVTETGQGGADGGIDLLLKRGSEKIIIQCKQWKTNSVGAPVVREMYGLMAHHKADSVKIVCCGHFTREAIAFAKGKPIDLIGGQELLTLVRGVQ